MYIYLYIIHRGTARLALERNQQPRTVVLCHGSLKTRLTKRVLKIVKKSLECIQKVSASAVSCPHLSATYMFVCVLREKNIVSFTGLFCKRVL